MQIDISNSSRIAAPLIIGLLAACGGGGAEHEFYIPHSLPPPNIIAFQLHYEAPAEPGGSSKLIVRPVGQNYVIASGGVMRVELSVFGREVLMPTQFGTEPSTGKPQFEFELSRDFVFGSYSCHDALSIVRVTDRFGVELSQSVELCPGASMDFESVSRDSF